MITGIHVKTLMLVPSLWLSVALCPSCVPGQVKVQSAERAVQESQIREAVIRFQMEEWSRNVDSSEARAVDRWEKKTAEELNYKVYFIRINGKDPSNEFVKRFSDIPRLVKKASQARSGLAGVLDRETRQTGIIFTADAIRWLKGDSVEVDGIYDCGGRCASARTFAVHFEEGKWTARLLRVNGIS